MADAKAPETWESLRAAACELGSTAGQLTRVLSAHGLAIVSEADRKVLEQMTECYDLTRDLELHSMAESDELWDHAEEAMQLIAKQRGEKWKMAELAARKTREK